MKAREVLGPLCFLGGLLIAAVLLHVLSRWIEARVAKIESWPRVTATVQEIRSQAARSGKWGTEPEYQLKLTTVVDNKTYWHTKHVSNKRRSTYWAGLAEDSQFNVRSNPQDPTHIVFEEQSRGFSRSVSAAAWLTSAAFLFSCFQVLRKSRARCPSAPHSNKMTSSS